MTRQNNNFWTIMIVVLLVLLGFRFIGVLFGLGFALIRLLIPVAIIGFAIYGFLKFLQDRR